MNLHLYVFLAGIIWNSQHFNHYPSELGLESSSLSEVIQMSLSTVMVPTSSWGPEVFRGQMT